MNKILSKVAAALAVALVLAFAPSSAIAMPAASARYGAGSFTVANTTLLSYGCFYHPYTVNLGVTGASYWDVDVRVLAPNGSVFEMDYLYGTGSGSASFPEDMFFCSSLDPAGTYTITGTVTTYDYYYDEIAATPLTSSAFTVSPYVAPAPTPTPVPVPAPAPVPAPTTTAPVFADVSGTVSKKLINRGVKFTFRAKALPSGTTLRKKLTWTIVSDGKFKTITQGPSSTKSLTMRFPGRSGKHLVKVLRNGKLATKVTVRA